MTYTLGVNDDIYVTTKDNVVHEAKAVESTNYGLYVNVPDMGHFTVKWDDIQTIHKIVKKDLQTCGISPRFKVLIWRNGSKQLHAC